MSRPPRLTDAEITARLGDHPSWRYTGNTLLRELTFETFVDAFGFMSTVALLAEKLDHHPDWRNVYNRVTIQLSTHDAGGVTELDFTLVRHIDRLQPV